TYRVKVTPVMPWVSFLLVHDCARHSKGGAQQQLLGENAIAWNRVLEDLWPAPEPVLRLASSSAARLRRHRGMTVRWRTPPGLSGAAYQGTCGRGRAVS